MKNKVITLSLIIVATMNQVALSKVDPLILQTLAYIFAKGSDLSNKEKLDLDRWMMDECYGYPNHIGRRNIGDLNTFYHTHFKDEMFEQTNCALTVFLIKEKIDKLIAAKKNDVTNKQSIK